MGNNALLRWESLIFVILIFVYLSYIILSSKEKIKNTKKEEKELDKIKIFKPMVYVILAIIGIAMGGETVVYGAKGFALNVANSLSIDSNMAETLVGLTIVAVGTSLPELVTTFIASKKGENELALGNVLGSNIFNVFFILGMSAIVTPLPTYSGLWLDALMVTLGSVLIMIFVYFTKKHEIKRWHGGVFVTLYICYLTYRLLTL